MAGIIQQSLSELKFKLSPERLRKKYTLEMPVEADFSLLLEKLKQDMGVALEPRQEGFHLTIISPTETKAVANLSRGQVIELQRINDDILRGIGITISGIGYIDGTAFSQIRKEDKDKKVAFVAIDIPAMQKFRESIGLPFKDFHVTLGFVGGDIHLETVGIDQKGNETVRPITKQANPDLDRYRHLLPAITFGGLVGREKQERERK